MAWIGWINIFPNTCLFVKLFEAVGLHWEFTSTSTNWFSSCQCLPGLQKSRCKQMQHMVLEVISLLMSSSWPEKVYSPISLCYLHSKASDLPCVSGLYLDLVSAAVSKSATYRQCIICHQKWRGREIRYICEVSFSKPGFCVLLCFKIYHSSVGFYILITQYHKAALLRVTNWFQRKRPVLVSRNSANNLTSPDLVSRNSAKNLMSYFKS